MLMDRENLFSYRQAITASAASQDQVYLGPTTWAGNANGAMDFPLIIAVNTPFAAAGAATLGIQVRSSRNSDMSSPTLHSSITLTLAQLTGSAPLPTYLTMQEGVLPYVDVYYTVTTGPFTAGVLTMGIVFARQTNR